MLCKLLFLFLHVGFRFLYSKQFLTAEIDSIYCRVRVFTVNLLYSQLLYLVCYHNVVKASITNITKNFIPYLNAIGKVFFCINCSNLNNITVIIYSSLYCTITISNIKLVASSLCYIIFTVQLKHMRNLQ